MRGLLFVLQMLHCRMLQVERFFQSRMLLRHCCRFLATMLPQHCCQKKQQCRSNIIVAGFGNNVERNFVLSTKSKQIEQVQFASTLSKGRYFTINSFDIVSVFGRFWWITLHMRRRGVWQTTTDAREQNDTGLCVGGPVTSLRCRWQTSATQYFASTVLYTETDVDGQCDKLWPMTVTSLLHWPST